MPDVHWGMGATVGSVIPTVGAIIPAAVGVDIGCGMMAVRTTLTASDLPDSSRRCARRSRSAVPHGRTEQRRPGRPRRLARPPAARGVGRLAPATRRSPTSTRGSTAANHVEHLGTLGTGNHFIEVCLDEATACGSCCTRARAGWATASARTSSSSPRDMRAGSSTCPTDLAYLPEGTEHFDDYVEAVGWAQDFARANRELMMEAVVAALRALRGLLPPFEAEARGGELPPQLRRARAALRRDVWVTRKGAVRARPRASSASSRAAWARARTSCAARATRELPLVQPRRGPRDVAHRGQEALHARRPRAATAGIECRKDADVIDETPGGLQGRSTR
jgi:tRNA-splicing ligase RtcB